MEKTIWPFHVLRWVFTLGFIAACSNKKHKCYDDSTWISKHESLLEFSCGVLTHNNLSATYAKTYDNYLDWYLAEGTEACYFAISATKEHGNFVCLDLEISEAFYRVK